MRQANLLFDFIDAILGYEAENDCKSKLDNSWNHCFNSNPRLFFITSTKIK